MEKPVCCTCQKPKATLQCGICVSDVCKNCAQFLDAGSFSFLKVLPKELSHTTYCMNCFDKEVAPALANYETTMAAAKEIQVFEKTQGKETRLIKRTEKPVEVLDCPDREETMLRLAFLAAALGFNAIIDADIRSEKVKVGGYQSTKWSGKALPANVSNRQLVKDRSIWQNPN